MRCLPGTQLRPTGALQASYHASAFAGLSNVNSPARLIWQAIRCALCCMQADLPPTTLLTDLDLDCHLSPCTCIVRLLCLVPLHHQASSGSIVQLLPPSPSFSLRQRQSQRVQESASMLVC